MAQIRTAPPPGFFAGLSRDGARVPLGRREPPSRMRGAPGLRLAATFAVALLPTGSALAETVSYDPESCADDAGGNVYVTLYGTVFAFPAEQPLFIGEVPPHWKERVPPPLNPEEPEGCPGHPMEGTSFSFAYHYADVKADRTASRSGRPDLLRIIAAPPDFWGIQPSNEQIFDKLCDRTGVVSDEVEGLDVCYTHPPEERREGVPDPRAVRAKASYYSAPFGRPLVAKCGLDASGAALSCNVTYKLYETVNVHYRFNTRNLGFDEIVDFDTGLRANLDDALRPALSQPYPADAPE